MKRTKAAPKEETEPEDAPRPEKRPHATLIALCSTQRSSDTQDDF